ncbi:MAG: family 20 glycosylhydrolase [bacterium]|nr:family 20 glycosylhydrolase [bacterium]
MNRLFAAIAVSLSLVSLVLAQAGEINVVPKPRSIILGTGKFGLRKDTKIVVRDEKGKLSANLLNEHLFKKYGFKLKIVNKPEKVNAINFWPIALDKSGGYPDEIKREKYSLTVQSESIQIGGTYTGDFYAIQTLMQMLPAQFAKEAFLPAVTIVDSPRFSYRGMHLDVSRHFQPVEFVKKFIDQMAQYKFNNFHWHLTDDQGWRIEIKKYPKLTEVGSQRPETMLERNFAPYKGDGIPHGGFYTQEQIKEVVAYAKARYITVVPEIELPGHASAALAAHPELGKGCAVADYKFEVKKTWGIFKEVFCPTEETFKFLEDVLDETIKLFPDSPYIHIGGDEVLKDFWKESAFVQELKKRENLKDEHEVQSYFVQRIEKFVNSKGKKIIGWDEILEGGIAPTATIMSWRGMNGGIEAAKAKHDVIMTPNDFVYFDYGQGDPEFEPLNIGSYVPLQKVYSFDPVPPELTTDEGKYVIGGQANIWTEYLKTPQSIEYMAFPRMLALSEVLWSKKEDRNYQNFYERMLAALPRLDKQGVNFRIPEPIDVGGFLLNETEAYAFEVRPPLPGAKVYFTKDGSTPTENSPEAPQKISVFPVGDEVVTIKTIVVLPSGRKSSVYAATFMRGKMLEAMTVENPKEGVKFNLVVPDNESQNRSGETKTILLNQFAMLADLKKDLGVQYDGYFKIPADGVYQFQIESTWDTTLVIAGKKIIDESGTSANVKRNAILPLKAGLHPISLRYNHRGGDSTFRFRWGLKGQGLRQAYGSEFVH